MPLDRLVLLPRPREVRPLPGPPVGQDAQPEDVVVGGLPREGFELRVGDDRVVIGAGDDNGRRYGHALLAQVRAQSTGGIEPMLVRDWPDFPIRSYLLDISRDRVPTMEYLDRLIELLALCRYNELQLYTEHTFAYASHRRVWSDASPMTAGETRALDARCAAAGIELAANQNTLGHMGRWLRHSAYRGQAEHPGGFEVVAGVTLPPETLAPTADNAAFVLSLLDELLPNFSSRRVNLNMDEAFGFGEGVSRAHAEAMGKGPLYLDYLRRIAGPLVADGRTVLIWADMLAHHADVIPELPAGIVPVVWTYEAPGSLAGFELPRRVLEILTRLGIDFDDRGFATKVAPFVESQTPFWVAGGTSSWNSLTGRISNALANLADAAAVGLTEGAGASS